MDDNFVTDVENKVKDILNYIKNRAESIFESSKKFASEHKISLIIAVVLILIFFKENKNGK